MVNFIFVVLYFLATHNTYTDSAGHNETCSVTEDCDDINNLVCVNEVCICDPTDFVYENYKCVGLAGTPCAWSEGCMALMECNQKCVCMSGFLENSARRCNLGYSGVCANYNHNVSDPYTCSEDFVCIDGKCGCPFPNSQQLVTTGDRKCLNLVSGSCSVNEDCVPNAECSDNNICSCSDGYTENVDGRCVLDYGTPCSYRNPGTVQPGTLDICDPLVPLQCYGGVCSCLDPSNVFNPDDRSCRLPIGSRCDPDPDKGNKCVENAFCAPNISPQLYGRCQSSTITTSVTEDNGEFSTTDNPNLSNVVLSEGIVTLLCFFVVLCYKL